MGLALAGWGLLWVCGLWTLGTLGGVGLLGCSLAMHALSSWVQLGCSLAVVQGTVYLKLDRFGWPFTVSFTEGEAQPSIKIEEEVTEIMAQWRLSTGEPAAVKLRQQIGTNKSLMKQVIPRLEREQKNNYEDSEANSKNNNKLSRKNTRTTQQ